MKFVSAPEVTSYIVWFLCHPVDQFPYNWHSEIPFASVDVKLNWILRFELKLAFLIGYSNTVEGAVEDI